MARRDKGATVDGLMEATLKLAQSQNMRQAASLRVCPNIKIGNVSAPCKAAWCLTIDVSCRAGFLPECTDSSITCLPLQALPFVHWALLYILGITFVLTLVLLEPGGRCEIGGVMYAVMREHRAVMCLQSPSSLCL